MVVVFPWIPAGVGRSNNGISGGKEGFRSMCELSVGDEGGEGRSKQIVSRS